MTSSPIPARDIALGLAALAGVLIIALLFVLGVIWVLSLMESQVAAAIAAASATAIASVLALILSKRYERKARIAQDIRERKTPVYEELLSILFKTLYADRLGRKSRSERDLAKVFSDLTPKMIVWGSQDVIRAWNDIRHHNWEGSDSAKSILLWNQLMIEIRKDLGNDVDRLHNLDLLRVFINDFHPAEAAA